jgi:hypothetical protein
MNVMLKQRQRNIKNIPTGKKVTDKTITKPVSVDKKLKIIVKEAHDQPHLSLNIRCMLNLNDVNQYLQYTDADERARMVTNTALNLYKDYITHTAKYGENASYLNISPEGTCVD